MQFVAIIYQGSTPLPGTPAWDALSESEQQQVYADYGALNQHPDVTGGPPLGLPSDATTVRVVDGETTTTPGSYVPTDHAVGGYFVLEADGLDQAVEVASRVPAARLGGALELRPVATYW